MKTELLTLLGGILLVLVVGFLFGRQGAAQLTPTVTPSPIVTASQNVTPTPGASVRLGPASGTYFGVNLNWETDSPAAYSERLGRRPALYVQFFKFPLGAAEFTYLDAAVKAAGGEGGMLMVTLEPQDGLAAVTPEAAAALADRLAAANAEGVSTFVRFAHEMNGSWYAWDQQPTAYIKAFRIVAEAVHSRSPRSAMLWAPNYGAGYPFKGGPFEIHQDSPEFDLLDTNHDGRLDITDDPYTPYYPGDDAVDWVGMSLYHWGSAYPWGENEIPETGKFIAQLTGNFNGLNGDERAVPDFYQLFYTMHKKPVAITETAAFYDPARTGPDELTLKQSWWRQVLDPTLLAAYPGIKMINWFEWKKPESEDQGALVDWRALGSPALAQQFRADLPLDRLIFAP